MKKVRVFVLSMAVACALSVPALGGIASADTQNPGQKGQNNTNGCPNQNMVLVNGVCVKQNG